MSDTLFKAKSDWDQIIRDYLTAAIRFADVQRERDFAAGDEFVTVLENKGKLLRENNKGQQLLSGLLTHEDIYVRIWAAKDCLFFATDGAVAVLEEIGKTPGLLGTSARTTLSEWRAGHLFK